MCSKKELFTQLDESVWGEVNFGNKSKVSIIGKGNIKIHSKDGTDVTITDVTFVLDIFSKFVEYVAINKKNGI